MDFIKASFIKPDFYEVCTNKFYTVPSVGDKVQVSTKDSYQIATVEDVYHTSDGNYPKVIVKLSDHLEPMKSAEV